MSSSLTFPTGVIISPTVEQSVITLNWSAGTNTLDFSLGNIFYTPTITVGGTVAISNLPTTTRFGFEWLIGSYDGIAVVNWTALGTNGDAFPTAAGRYIITGISIINTGINTAIWKVGAR